MVHVGIVRVALSAEPGVKCVLGWKPSVSLVPADRYRTFGTVEVIVDVSIGF
jgi:hypothetical protein